MCFHYIFVIFSYLLLDPTEDVGTCGSSSFCFPSCSFGAIVNRLSNTEVITFSGLLLSTSF